MIEEGESLMPNRAETHKLTYTNWNNLTEFARDLPAQLALAYACEHRHNHNIKANQLELEVDRFIDILVGMWTHLAACYPPGHFKGKEPEAYFRHYLADRLTWRSVLVHGDTPNPMKALEIKRAVLSDAEDAVADTVSAIFRDNDQVILKVWADWWQDARSVRNRSSQ